MISGVECFRKIDKGNAITIWDSLSILTSQNSYQKEIKSIDMTVQLKLIYTKLG